MAIWGGQTRAKPSLIEEQREDPWSGWVHRQVEGFELKNSFNKPIQPTRVVEGRLLHRSHDFIGEVNGGRRVGRRARIQTEPKRSMSMALGPITRRAERLE